MGEFMKRFIAAIGVIIFSALAHAADPTTGASDSTDIAKRLYDDVTPSLVGVQYTWEYEFGKADFVGAGVVVSSDGLVMIPLTVIDPRIPDSQLIDFKIVVPHVDKDDEEIDATFQGRDERNNVAFVRAKPASSGETHQWKPLKFVPAKDQLSVGQHVLSIGLMPKTAGYRSYLAEATIASRLRGEMKQFLVTGGGLAAIGSPVFDLDGNAIGYVPYQTGQQYLLHTTARRGRGGDDENQTTMYSVERPPHLFFPSEEILQALQEPPKDGKSIPMPWIGTPQLTGVKKEVAEYLGIENQPAVEIGDVVSGAPADKAGLKVGMRILKFNGQPLERGDEPDEVATIMARKIFRTPIGEKVTFSVMTDKDKPLQDISVTLEERPRRSNQVKRFWAEDLGFSAREVVWEDTYVRKQSGDMKGVVIAIVKPQSASASAKLQQGDVVTTLNGTKVQTLDQFEHDYKEFRQSKPKEAIVMVVMKSDATTQTIRIEPPQE
jgi:serine protease Do